jgi:predicted 3-demethylubiquinone-9 3-methyltransferase (glyoxalase superfamily)
MSHSIGTCLWFDGKGKEAFDFYKKVFNNGAELVSQNPMAVVYNLFGRRFMHLNGGPGHPITPAISFYIMAENNEEAETIWSQLIIDGKVLMPLNEYPWSKKYGWCADKFGVNWQIIVDYKSSCKVMPSLMFCGNNAGKAEEAITYYRSLFTNSSLVEMRKYEKGGHDIEGYIMYAQFELNNLPFGIMDNSAPHAFSITDAVSFTISVNTQDEIDYYWDYLTKDGAPGKCGWLQDKYGVHWQVVPSILGKYMTNPATAPKATYAFLQMSKFIIADLEKAVEENN